MMSAEYSPEMFKDKRVRAKVNYNVLVLVCILGANIVALLAFSSYFRPSTPVQPKLPQRDLMEATIIADSISRHPLMLQLKDSQSDMRNVLAELMRMRQEIQELREQTEVLTARLAQLTTMDNNRAPDRVIIKEEELEEQNNPWMLWARGKMPAELHEYTAVRKLPLGWNPALGSDSIVASVGHGCAYSREDLANYMDYEVGAICPDDEALAQKLLLRGCEPLPRRRCFARKPLNFTEPVPFPDSLWTIPQDNNVLWTAHACKSFYCLNERSKLKVFADCLDCFNLDGREKHRWVEFPGALAYTISDVLKIKPEGTIRIGLDIGGGTGSFAARMREHNVTIVTSTLNLAGPFNSFIAHRGLVPLFLTISQRLPFFDNTLDLVHSMHVLSNWIPIESLEFLLYDIDRALRPGGLFWLDHFFCVESQVNTYTTMIEQFGFVKHKWHVGPKLDRGPQFNERYISAVLEKPRGIRRRAVR